MLMCQDRGDDNSSREIDGLFGEAESTGRNNKMDAIDDNGIDVPSNNDSDGASTDDGSSCFTISKEEDEKGDNSSIDISKESTR